MVKLLDRVYYRVQDGDSLESISREHSASINNITRNNPDIPLYVGEVVRIDRDRIIYHIVTPADTLAKIADKYKTSVEDIIKSNNLMSTQLYLGQRLEIEDKNIVVTKKSPD